MARIELLLDGKLILLTVCKSCERVFPNEITCTLCGHIADPAVIRDFGLICEDCHIHKIAEQITTKTPSPGHAWAIIGACPVNTRANKGKSRPSVPYVTRRPALTSHLYAFTDKKAL